MTTACLGDHFCCFFKIAASSSVGLGEEVLDQAHSDIVAHSIELSINLDIIAIIVITKLRHDRAIC